MATRDRLLVIFDEQYCSKGNLVYAATKELIRQTGGTAQYRIFCKGRYAGPRFTSQLGDVRVISRRTTSIAEKRGWPGRMLRLLARLHLRDAPNRWLTNLDAAERRLVRLLFEVERTQAVIVFTVDAAFALKITRLVHIFANTQIPHIIAVTPAGLTDSETVRDLRWLRATLLLDGSLTPATESRAAIWRLPRGAGRPAIAGRIVGGARSIAPIPFDQPQPLSFLDPESYPYQMGSIETTIVWDDWIGTHRQLPDRVRNVVLFIRPDWMNCGTGTLFESLATYFRNGDGLLIDIGIWPYAVPFKRDENQPEVAEEQRHIRSALYFSLRRTTNFFSAMIQLLQVVNYWPRTVSNQILLQHALVAKPRLVRDIVRRAKLSHIYLNHYFTYLFAKDLIAGRKFFLDTHDIQAINVVHNDARNLFTRRGDPFPELLNEEMRIVRKAHRIGFVSEGELEIASRYVPAEKLRFIIPLPSIKPCTPKPIGKPARLLIIAARNRGNERNLAWFLDQVWPKVVGSGPISDSFIANNAVPQLDICGGIRGAFLNTRAPRVRFHGIVADLQPYYQHSDLVLLPVVTGSGVAVKTIEALLYERPVLATQQALRGLPEAIVETVGYYNQPQEFADAICDLISSPYLLRQRLDQSRRAAQMLRDQGFYDRLTRAMDDVLVSDTVRQPDEVAGARSSEFQAVPLSAGSSGHS